jgi:hypothetical protein
VIKPKNGLRPKNRGKQKQNRGRGAAAEPTKSMDLWTRMMNYFTEVPSRARGFALRLRRPGGSIEIRGAGGERATGTCFCVARAALFFACVRPPPPKNRKTDRSKKTKKTFYIALLLRAGDQTEPKRTRFFWPVLLGPKEPGSFGENPKEPGSFYGVLFVGFFWQNHWQGRRAHQTMYFCSRLRKWCVCNC